MSTYFYLVCLDHDPPLESNDEVSQHDDEHVENAIRLANGTMSATEFAGLADTYFEQHAVQFLTAHPKCALRLATEYGDQRPVPGREKGTHDESR